MANKMPSQPPSVATLQEVIEVHLLTRQFASSRCMPCFESLCTAPSLSPMSRRRLTMRCSSPSALTLGTCWSSSFVTLTRTIMRPLWTMPTQTTKSLTWKKIRMRRRCTKSCVPKSIILTYKRTDADNKKIPVLTEFFSKFLVS